MKFSLLAALFGVVLCAPPALAQGDLCANFTEFCPAPDGSDLFYPAGVNTGSAEPGNDYGCLSTTPNPAWYYLQIGDDGSVTIELSNTNNEDIDFALWGPFDDLDQAAAACGSLDSPVDCSYSVSDEETVQIPQSQRNEIYILLITNYSNDPTNIIAEATGEGVPSCCRVPINTGETCADPTEFACGCWTLGINGRLPLTNPIVPPTDFCGTTENAQWISLDNCWCRATFEVTVPPGGAGAGVEAQLFRGCGPYEPLSGCITVAPGQTLALPSLDNGGAVLDCEPGDTYFLLLDGVAGDTATYTVQATEVPLDPPQWQQDTVLGPTTVCGFDTMVYQFPPVLGDFEYCTASWSGGGPGVLSADHGGILLVTGAPGSNGELCITVGNCAGQTTYCQPLTVVACCASDPGNLAPNAYDLCADEVITVQHLGDSTIAPDETGQYLLHDGPGNGVIGNIFLQNTSGTFGFFDDLNFDQTYTIDFVVMGLNAAGQPDPSVCFQAGGNSNPVVWRSSTPALESTVPVFDCNSTESFYTVTLELTNGTSYFVNGEPTGGNTFTSTALPTGSDYAFTITDENDCLEPLVVAGTYACPCLTDAGVLDDTPVELCDTDLHTATILTPATLDANDVVVYELRSASGAVLLTNAAEPTFAFGPPLVYGTTYFVCARAGNATANGPLLDYPCASSSNCQPVTFYDQITATLPAAVELTCADPAPQLVPQLTGGSGVYDYEWLTPSGAVATDRLLLATEAGTYQLTVSDQNNDCTVLSTVEVTEAPVPTELQYTAVPPTCTDDEDGLIQLDSVVGGVAPFTYRLDSLPWTDRRTYPFLRAGDHLLQIRDANDCELSTLIELPNPPEPQVSLGNDVEIALGEVAHLEAVTNLTDFAIDWYLDGELQTDTLPTLDSMFLRSTAVAVQIFDANECSGEDAIRVTVRRDPPLFVPNAFSPNGDGVNDRFGLFANASVREIVDFRVFDRWGSLVFERTDFSANDPRTGWDGFFRGRPSGVGVYVYTITVRYVDGRTETFGGDVSLLR